MSGAGNHRRLDDVAPPWLRSVVWVVQQVGFPIAVAAFLLWRVDGMILEITASLRVVAADQARTLDLVHRALELIIGYKGPP